MTSIGKDPLACLIWEASRADEGTISATGADHVAAALRSAGLAFAEHGTAPAMRFAAVEVAMLENRTNSYSTNIAELLNAAADAIDERKRAEEYAAAHIVFWQGTAPGTKASIVDALLGFAGAEAKS